MNKSVSFAKQVLVKAKTGSDLASLLMALAKIPGVTEAKVLTEEWDFRLVIKAAEQAKLDAIVSQIRAIAGVAQIQVLPWV